MASAVDTKRTNICLTLDALRSFEGATQPEICKQTGLTASTVHGIVSAMCQKGLAAECGTASSSGGRKAACYRLNPAYRRIVAVAVRLSGFSVGLYNLALEQESCQTQALPLFSVGSEEYVLRLASAITELLAGAGINPAELAGVGLTLPAPCHADTGVVHRICGSTQWDQFPLAARLSGLLGGLRVLVEKDVYAAASRLYAEGALAGPGGGVFLSIDGGVGAALLGEGGILSGKHSVAGEIGHIPVRGDGRKCRCGNSGCLELYCSETGLLEQYAAQGGDAQAMEELLALAEAGDETAQQLLSQAVHYLIGAIYSLILHYDPARITIMCRWLSLKHRLFMRLLEQVYARSLFTSDHHVELSLFTREDLFLESAAGVVAGLVLGEMPELLL